MESPRFLIDTLPPEVATRFAALQQRGVNAAGPGGIEGAFEASGAAYDWLVSKQPRGHRFHKGWPLHNMGMIRLQTGPATDARDYFLRAFVEDALSRGEESPTRYDETSRPAALNLVYLFEVPGRSVVDLARRLRERQREGALFQTPEAALDAEPLFAALPQAAEEAADDLEEPEHEHEPEWRRVSEFGVPWEDRVFVGGNYRQHMPTLRVVRDEVRRHGFDGVLVAEFRAPPSMSVRSKSLTLLKACRRAIFELSAAAGQLVEFDHLLEYETEDVLVVFNSSVETPGQISAMTKSLYGRVKVVEEGYASAADLRRIVTEWLGSPTDDTPTSRLGGPPVK